MRSIAAWRHASQGVAPLRLAWPYLALLVSLVAIDQLVFLMVPRVEWTRAVEDNYALFERTRDNTRPQLIVLGSSRARDSLPIDTLRRVASEQDLPHQVFNLGIGGGGTPALLYSALKDWTTALSALPPGSKVIYIFSYFEMNFLQVESMLELTTGRELLRRFNMAKTDHWAYRLAEHSGFAQLISERAWKFDLPADVTRVIQESVAPMQFERMLPQSCNYAGRYNYQILPINDWALRELIARLGEKLILVGPAVSRRQTAEDARFGLIARGEAYMRTLARQTGVKYLPQLNNGFPESAFGAIDCDHLHLKADQERLARNIVGLVRP